MKIDFENSKVFYLISAYVKCYILSGFLLRAIIRKALELEYRIQRRSLLKDDFIRYVQYEINLLDLIEKRRARVGYTFKKDEIEDPIIHRIQSVFRRASIKWKDDVRLWLSFIAFCRKWASNIHLSKIFSSLLAFHSNKPGMAISSLVLYLPFFVDSSHFGIYFALFSPLHCELVLTMREWYFS